MFMLISKPSKNSLCADFDFDILFPLVSVQRKLCCLAHTFLDGQSVFVDVGLPWLPSTSMHIENVHKY